MRAAASHGASALLAAMAACAVAAPAFAADAERAWPPSRAALDALGRAIASEGCARPVEVKTSFIRSPRGAETSDEMRSIDCRGVRLALYVARNGDARRESPMELVVERAHARIDARIGVGADAAAVRALLGEPQTSRGSTFGYTLRGRDQLFFEVQDGRVRAVAWSWDVD